ncbi:LysR family transcriptional regulator [Bradyrhizobium sp. INPA01-394B]|uniref:LysR family transcriptional regulator n=1 Tax=Bradyrhizobium campsiandrae TaxID=1729892 RepID=A0ABR7UBV0_9BRAD|nr:LysR family transcriptional regulator [Bradyrhizobium campsiandrae]MBC9878847.1 LysR family transcriptional regulator [Bradyrhizobium campsiandrae]MBC9980892.1 LysR family transcriptional regulator [Bradyrhizobium campsiandrae]
MEMQQIRYFIALVEHSNFTRAADACNVTQPSLTRAIKQLEHEFGGQLFHRERPNVRPTDLAQIVMPHLKQVYEEAHNARRIAEAFATEKKFKLRLGVMCTIAPTLLIELLNSVKERDTRLEVEIRDSSARKLDEELLEGSLDIAIYCIPGETPNPRLHTMPLFREQMMIVLPPHHPLGGRTAIQLRDLHRQRYLNRSSCEFNGYADKFFEAQGVEIETVYRSDRDDWIQALVRSGLGFGFMPEYTVTDPAVVTRPTMAPEFWRDVNLVTVRGRRHTPAVGALVREAMRVTWHGKPAISVAERANRTKRRQDLPTVQG